MEDTMNRIIRGVGTYGNPVIHGNLSKIYIGKYCSISDNAILDCGFQHNTSFVSMYPFNQKMQGCENLSGHPHTKGDIHIGNDVWIGDNAVIMSGVKIGDGAIISHSAVVTKNIPPYTIVGGVPAEFIRHRLEYEQVNKMIEIKWWDWPEEKIKENAHLLMSNRIDEFIKLHL